ncbi:MAG: hypothetical protein OXE94_10970 [Aestuariivita sp.]|nr:hypothetical protein [Aestuariivita sp.]MCY4203339.1 hypothetical protein [Aestuariivita sp.]
MPLTTIGQHGVLISEATPRLPLVKDHRGCISLGLLQLADAAMFLHAMRIYFLP